RVRMAFRNVGAFRSLPTDNILNDTGFVPGVPGEERQPLCNESWGIQCEVYPAQLADEIDLEKTPQVKLLWFEGLSPWGYENWRDRAKSAWLARATDTNLVYRSSYVTSPAAVMDPSTWPGTVVQYVLEVIYYQIGSNQPITNRLSSSEWTKPEWYRGIDYNRDRGGNESFAAYNILDTVAPHWAWINEANIFGGYDADGQNDDRRVQYIEVAVPAEADISSWGLNLLVAHDTTGIVYTNRLATFGEDNLAGRKRNLVGMESNMVFRVVASPLARQYQQLDASKGEIDGVWRTPTLGTPEFTQSGEIDAFSPVGIQLVRGSGILEHEIVALGTNYYSRVGMPEGLQKSHNPSNVAEFLNARLADSAFIAVPEDSFSAAASVGVFRDSGETPGAWTNVFGKTPGRINGGQTINPNHPTPNGSSLIVYANLAPSGHILQSLGNNIVNTNGNVILIVPKGLVGGTNITYTIDKWYELDSVTTNAVAASAVKSGDRQYVLTVADNCSNNVTVVAAARVSEYLTNLGVTENNRYTPAVMEWLREGRNAWGEPWANTDADTVRLADFIGASGSVITNLSLTEMYWFDMDPTVGDLALKAHFSKAPTTKTVVANEQTGALRTNVNIGVFMMVTNRATGEAWTPYVLRGLDPGSKSWDMTNETASAWTSVTFKVTGIMPTEHVDIGFFSKDWIPLRWFVFQPDSFRPLTASENPGVTFIDVVDPHSPSSPGYGAGWWRYPELTPYFKWDIDERLKPYTVESLKQDNDI
ncbi:MAG: hypothetical protein IKD42_02505, partial [Kiritimatiellae bacterium]|nr:hypothetical protein [Kiritimatiellia bacterium]